MKIKVSIFLISIWYLTSSLGTTSLKAQGVDKLTNVELTKKVCEIKEIQNLLLTKNPDNKDAVFVYLNPVFFDKEIIDTELLVPFNLLYKKTLFFYNLNYWLLPISINKEANKIHYHFRTCSFVKDEDKKYYEGLVTFKLVGEKWIIDNYKIGKGDFLCGQIEK